MNRRRLLAALGAGVAGLAGCSGSSSTNATREAFTLSPTPTPQRGQVGSVEIPVPRSELDQPLPRDAIPAIVDPVFAEDWSGLTVPDSSPYDGGPLLPADAPVLGVEREGAARAYPLRVLDWHEVVNDTFAGPLLVTYCPLCGSGVTAERRVDGEETVFGVSGRLWRDDLVMYDRATESLWSQILGAAIRGPRAGERLSLVPSSLTSWGEWQDTHPETRVLLPPPRSNTVSGRDATYDYFTPKYTYEGDQLIGRTDGARGQPAERRFVVGVERDGQARAYPFDVVVEEGVVNDRVGDLPVVVTTTPGDTLVAYDRRVEGSTLRFETDDAAHLRAGGSRWERATGRAVDGPHEGRRLDSATDTGPMFWKGWRNFHPDTSIYDEESD
jgi:hypothetical protein